MRASGSLDKNKSTISDPRDAKKPMQTFEATLKADVEEKTKVMETQRKLLEGRYNLTPRLDSEAKMFRGKPLAVGPTAKLPEGLDWERLAKMTPDEIKKAGIFPYPSLPHPKQQPGGQVFPQVQIAMFPRLQRFDVDFDLPEAFLPEFHPALQMQNMFDFPPAPKLNSEGKLDANNATESEIRGQKVFVGKGQCASCHQPPNYLDNQMHDLRLDRFVNEPSVGPIKTFTLRGIKESPPYMHDGRCLTLEDTVEFFNLVGCNSS
jgi:hypothetical protein